MIAQYLLFLGTMFGSVTLFVTGVYPTNPGLMVLAALFFFG